MNIVTSDKDSPINEFKYTIRIFGANGTETLRLESNMISTVIDSFTKIAKSWDWVYDHVLKEYQEFEVKSWSIGTAQQFKNGCTGTVQLYKGRYVK